MSYTINQFVACGSLVAVLLASAGCEPKRIPPMTVADLMGDRVTLDGVLMKCNQNAAKARNDGDCLNARIAIERLAKDVDAEFEKSREQLRLAQEKARQEQEAKTKFNAYDLPLVPVDSAAPGGTATAKP
jgi:hypothetical protein